MKIGKIGKDSQTISLSLPSIHAMVTQGRRVGVDMKAEEADNQVMVPSTVQTVNSYRKASAEFRKSIQGSPALAKQMLVQSGIAVKKPSAPTGLVLAKRYRPAK